MPSLDETTDAILDYLTNSFAQPVFEMGVPDTDTVPRNEVGAIYPLIAVQFGDIIPMGARNMATPRGDDYHIPIYIQFVAPRPKIARQLYNKGIDVFLGESFPFSGSVRKRVGGGMFTLNGSNGATEAYMYPASFALLTQLVDGV